MLLEISSDPNHPIFPSSHDTVLHGLTLREYLVGQAIAGTANSDKPYIAENALRLTDEVIKLLNETYKAEADIPKEDAFILLL